MTLVELYAYIRDGGTLAVLVAIIVGGYKGWYVWKREADEYREEIRDLKRRLERAEAIAAGGTALARRATSLAERAGDADA